MGSWDVSCHLTGVHIGVGDRAALVPIRIKPTSLYDKEPEAIRVFGLTSLMSNSGCNVYFDEVTFPIFGQYGDYGRLEDIVKDDNTAILEEYFELTIDQIVEVLCDNRKSEVIYQPDMSDSSRVIDITNPKHVELLSFSITWIHGDVYDKLKRAENTSGGWNTSIELGHRTLLEELGFEFKGTDEKRDRYNQKFQKGKMVVYSDGTWIEGGIYRLKDLKEACAKKGVDIDITVADNKTYYEQVFDYIGKDYLKGLADAKEKEKKYRELLAKHSAELDIVEDARVDYSIARLLFGGSKSRYSFLFLDGDMPLVQPNVKAVAEHFEKSIAQKEGWTKVTKAFKDKQRKLLKKLEDNCKNHRDTLSSLYATRAAETENLLRSNVTEWFTVKAFFHSMGRILFPIGTSPQWGDTEATKQVLEAAMDVVNAEIAEQAELDEFDDE